MVLDKKEYPIGKCKKCGYQIIMHKSQIGHNLDTKCVCGAIASFEVTK